MTDPIRLAAIVGSLRRESLSRAVLTAATELLPDGSEVVEVPLAGVPLYDGDLEAAGDPPAVTALKHGVDSANGLLIFTPEYNRSVPAVTKNAVDWLSRPPGGSVLGDTTVGIVAVTPGRHPAAGVRDHLATAVGAVTDRVFDPSLGIGSVTRLLDHEQRLVDAEERARLAGWLTDFVRAVSENRPSREEARQ